MKYGCFYCPKRKMLHQTFGTPKIGCECDKSIRPQEYSEYYLEHRLNDCPLEGKE